MFRFYSRLSGDWGGGIRRHGKCLQQERGWCVHPWDYGMCDICGCRRGEWVVVYVQRKIEHGSSSHLYFCKVMKDESVPPECVRRHGGAIQRVLKARYPDDDEGAELGEDVISGKIFPRLYPFPTIGLS